MAEIDATVKKQFVDSINRVNKSNLTLGDLEFGEIRQTSSGLHNATIDATGVSEKASGEKTFLYTRIDISKYVGLLCTTLVARPAVRVSDLLDEINRNCKLGLNVTDIIDEVVNLNGDEGETFTLRCSSDSPKYTGSLQFTMHVKAAIAVSGIMSVLKGARFRVYNGANAAAGYAPYTTLLIGGIEHQIGNDGYVTIAADSGDVPFYYSGPTLGTFGQNAPIKVLSRFIAMDDTVASGYLFFFNNRTLETIGDDIFRGSLGVISLNRFCASCTRLTSVGSGFFSAPHGYSSYEGTFNGCDHLTTIGESDVKIDNQPLTSANNMFLGCRRLEKIPDNIFKNCGNLVDVNSAFYSVGIDAPELSYFPEGLFDSAPNITDAGNVFNSARARHWPSRVFKNHTSLSIIASGFANSNIPKVPDGEFTALSKSLNASLAFQNTTLTSVGSGLFPTGGSVNVDSLFLGAKIDTVDRDIFNGATLTSVVSLFNGATIIDPIPNLFPDHTEITSLFSLFRGATITLTEENRALFESLTEVTNIGSIFYSTVFRTGVLPAGIFDNLVKVTELTYAFRAARGGDATLVIPVGIFANQNLAKDFSLVFVSTANIRFEGSVLPSSGSATTLYNMFGSCGATEFPADLLANGGGVLSLQRAFESTVVTEIPDGFFDACRNVTNINSLFSSARNLTTVPADCFAVFDKVTSAVQLFATWKQPFNVPEGLFDPLVNVKDMGSLFYNSVAVTLPKNAFFNCINLTSFTQPFLNVALSGDLENMFNPLLAEKATDITRLFQRVDMQNTNFGNVVMNIPLTGTISQAFEANPNTVSLDVSDFLIAIGADETNHILDVNDKVKPSGFIVTGHWLSGSKSDLIKGLWGVSDAAMVPTDVVDTVLFGVSSVT